MAETAEDIVSQKAALEAVTKSDPNDYESQLKLAQIEARIWIQDATQGDLGTLVRRLDYALANLPPENHPRMLDFVHQLHQRGAGLAPVIEAGDYPRLAALLRREEVPQGPLPASAAPAPPVAPVSPSPTPPPPPAHAAPPQARPVVGIQTGAPTGDLSRSAPAQPSRTRAREIDASEASNADLKTWIAEGRIEELAGAFQYMDNFRTRRIIIDKVAEPGSPLAIACLLRMLSCVDDPKLTVEIRRRISEFDENLLQRELRYDPEDHEGKLSIVDALAAVGKEFAVEPLTQALNDPDEDVRSLAVNALAKILEADEEWMDQLGLMAARDPSNEVKIAAARALEAIATPDAMRALEKAGRGGLLSDEVGEILEDMRATIGKSDRAARKQRLAEEEKDKKKPAKQKAESSIEKSDYVKLLMVIGGFAIAGYVAYNQFFGKKTDFSDPAERIYKIPSNADAEQLNKELKEKMDMLRSPPVKK